MFSLRKINMKSNLFSLKLFCTPKKRKTIVSDLTQSIQLTMTYLANSSVTTIILEKLKRDSRSEIFSNYFTRQCHHNVKQTVWGSFLFLIPTPGILQMFKCPILFILLWCWRSWQKKSAENFNWSCQSGWASQVSLMGERGKGGKIVLKGWRTENLCRPLKGP